MKLLKNFFQLKFKDISTGCFNRLQYHRVSTKYEQEVGN